MAEVMEAGITDNLSEQLFIPAFYFSLQAFYSYKNFAESLTIWNQIRQHYLFLNQNSFLTMGTNKN